MAHRPVHWEEGMFLRPHHFQAAQRHWFQWANTSEKWDNHYNWGLRAIDIDHDALATFRLVIRSLKARLRDGSLISTDEDGQITPVDLKEHLDQQPKLTVFLAVPIFGLTKANVGSDGALGARYAIDSQDLEDENTGINPQPIRVRRTNYRLLFSTENQTGYETLPIARIEKSAKGMAELDKRYIPPVLACDAWQPLKNEFLEKIHHRIAGIAKLKADRMIRNGVTPDSPGGGDDRLLVDTIRILNEPAATLPVLYSAYGVHPLQAYQELWRIAGQLAIFDEKLRCPPATILPYDHEDLWRCFDEVRRYIDARLDKIGTEKEIIERPFMGAGPRMEVTLEPRFLEPGRSMFVGVFCKQLKQNECDRFLNRQLEMKIASVQRVEDIFRHGERGLHLKFCPQPPRDLPTSNFTFFEIDRAAQADEWATVQRDLNLAIRLNIKGDLTGQRAVTVNDAGRSIGFQFTLFIVPKKESQ